MAEPKPLASLTSGLLARKGAAQPAMRRPMMGFGRTVGNAVPQDDLGWNDMGFDVEPVPSPAPGRKAAFTLRLEAERHLKLRLACAVTGRSAQQIVTQALDDFIDTLPEIDRLTQQLPQMRGDKA